ncbi:MAG: NADPH-dependent F420 reductase [Acidimicrobiales bacterium]
MRFAVLGTGMVGQTIAGKLESLGHEVVMGTRDVAASMARTDGDGRGTPPVSQWLTQHAGVGLAGFADAAQSAETVVNTTAGMVSMSVLAAAGEANLAGKVLIDIANPLDFSAGMPPTLNPCNTESLGEQIQNAFPAALVVKTLNTMRTQVMVDPARVPGNHTVFLSGDDPAAKATVTEVLRSFGWSPANILDLGPISTARGAEMLLPVWLSVAAALGHFDFNIHIQVAEPTP